MKVERYKKASRGSDLHSQRYWCVCYKVAREFAEFVHEVPREAPSVMDAAGVGRICDSGGAAADKEFTCVFEPMVHQVLLR